jgi:3-deoxy-D-manno-octulosonate 8-phosphate phosphatase (KDO 8-P phosphatase)
MKPTPAELQELAARVRLFIFDVDGVLTDGGLYYGPQGEALKRFDVKDGHGIVLARQSGIPSVVLTARSSPMVEARAKELQLLEVLQGQRDKLAALESLLTRHGIRAEQCAYMGDDLIDLPVLTRVGLSACPADAVAEVREAVAWVSTQPGGRGAVRELVELCLRAQGSWAS